MRTRVDFRLRLVAWLERTRFSSLGLRLLTRLADEYEESAAIVRGIGIEVTVRERRRALVEERGPAPGRCACLESANRT